MTYNYKTDTDLNDNDRLVYELGDALIERAIDPNYMTIRHILSGNGILDRLGFDSLIGEEGFIKMYQAREKEGY